MNNLYNSANTCYICLDQSGPGNLYNLCSPSGNSLIGHAVHPKCLNDWLEHSNDLRCPVCRSDLLNDINKLNITNDPELIKLSGTATRISENSMTTSQKSSTQDGRRMVYINSDLAFDLGLY